MHHVCGYPHWLNVVGLRADEMRRVVHELADKLDARNGGLMLSPTHVLEPEVPVENVVAFFETCDRL